MDESDRTPLVVVGVDGSTDSRAAVAWAHRYALAAGASLRLVTAWDWPMSFGYAFDYESYSPETDANTQVQKALADSDLPAGRVGTMVVEGAAGHELVRLSEHADLLVVGSHGHRPVAGLLLGSVSSYCVHHSHVPVVVVR